MHMHICVLHMQNISYVPSYVCMQRQGGLLFTAAEVMELEAIAKEVCDSNSHPDHGLICCLDHQSRPIDDINL